MNRLTASLHHNKVQLNRMAILFGSFASFAHYQDIRSLVVYRMVVLPRIYLPRAYIGKYLGEPFDYNYKSITKKR